MPETQKTISRFSSFLARSLALFVCASLVPLTPPAAASSIQEPSSLSFKFDVPDHLGRIEEFVPGDSGRTVYFIQDAHDSLEAQENIAALIHHLVQKEGVDKVFEEGYEGPVPSDTYFGVIQDPDIREKVSYYFMDKLLLGGAEYAHINRDEDFELIGADSIRLHFDNVEAYQSVLRVQDESARALEVLASELRSLSDEVFGNSLKTWMKLKARHEAGEIDFLDYLRRTRALRAKPQKDAFPLLDLILKDSRSDQENSLLDRVDAKAVFAEQERLESALAADYLAKEDDLRLFHALRGVQLLQRLNKLSVSAAEYSAVHGVLRECETRTLARFIVRKTGRTLVLSRDWEENLKPAFRFYETALSRDAFIEKALSRHASSKSVLVYGGFHLPGIREILKRRGDSYYVLSPKITSASGKHAEYYRELMAGGFSRLAIPGIVSKAAVAPRAYEFTALDNSQGEVFVGLLRSAESAVKKLPEAERGRLSAEVDLILAQNKPRDPMPLSSLRSELRTNDDERKENLGKLFSRLGNQLDGNTLSPEWVGHKNYGGLLLQIQERLDFVIMSVRENDYFSVRRAIESIRKDLPEDGAFDGARETLSEIHTLLADSRSELRDSKGEEEDLSSAQIHAYRLARERKVVGLPYFAKHHQISFADASKALINAGFESLGPSEVGEQFVHPFTREDETRLLKENEPAGEDEDKTNPILRAGMEINAFKELLENKTVQDPGRPVILSAIPSELKDASDPEKKVFIFRENMIHGLNNVATYLMFSPRSVTYYMMLNAADDLWATLKILDDITARPVNDYPQISENLKDLLYTRNAATRTGAGAVESAAAGQFSELHYAEIRALRRRLEKVYGRVVELVVQREKEYLLREESRREASQKWDGTDGFVFSARDLSFAGQMAPEDLQRLKQVLSASREDLKRLVKEKPGELYFKAEDGLFEEEGRSVYLKLKVPVDVFSRGRKKQIDRLRIKGLKPAVDVRGTSVYLGRGSVQNRIIPGADGSLQSVPDTQSPKGGIRASSARQEYEVMKRALDAKRFETDYPVAWGIFEGFPFLGEDTGFVIAGLDGEDMRLSTTPGDEPSEVLFSAAPVQRKSGGEMDDDSARVLFEAFGRSLRAYHDEGFYHGFPHLGNIGVRLVKGRFEIILRDLNTTKISSADMTREEETAYRFIDTADFVVRLLNRGKENFSEPFLKGYFHGFDQDTEVFRKMTDAVKDLSFLVEFLRLDDSLPPAVQMDDGRILQIREKYPPLQTLKINQEHPEFGALWENLTAAVQNRSELRYDDGLISFLHDHVFIHRYGHYEILADYRYADLEAIDQETLRLTAEKPAAVLPGPFRVVLLNAYQSETGEGRKNPHIVILSDDSEKPTAWGFVTLQDAAVFLDGMDDPSLFSPGESLDDSYFVTRTDIFADYYGQALMQRAVTALLLKGAIRKWIPSPTQLYPSRRMYERMKADPRLVLEGLNRVKLVTARSELREEREIAEESILASQPSDEEVFRRLTRVKFPDFLTSSTAYLLLSPQYKTVIKFFDPVPPFAMYSDEIWKFWLRGAVKTLLGWTDYDVKRNYGKGYETMARYRIEHPGLPEHIRTRVLRHRNALRLPGVPALLRVALMPHRLWVVQDYVPQNWFVSQRMVSAVQSGELNKARSAIDVSLDYFKSFWKDAHLDADLGINILENYLIAGPEKRGAFDLLDVDFHDHGAFTRDLVRIKRFFDSVRRSVDRMDAGLAQGKPLQKVLIEMGGEKPEYPFRNILTRVYSLLPDNPDDADALARHFLDRVRAEFTFEAYLKAAKIEYVLKSDTVTETRSELRSQDLSDVRQEGTIGTQEDLALDIAENWEAIRERGFFMFDMQKTLAARKKPASEGMIKLLAWMLEEKVRLVINSGNPMKDVDDQVLTPLKKFLAAEDKMHLLAGGVFSVYSASGTVFVTFDEQGNHVEHPDYEAGLVIARPVLEQSIHDVLVEFGKKKFGLDAAGIENLRTSYIKDASKNSGLIYELPWADTSEAYEPSRVHFDDLGSKAMRVRGPYIQLRGSRVTEEEATSITITKLPSEIRPAIIARLKELLKERLGADFVNHLSISVGGESSIDIFSADANKAKALIHYVERAAVKSDRPFIEISQGYYFGDELTGNVHGSTIESEFHKGNDMIVAEYPFPDQKYGQIKLAALSPDFPAGFAPQDARRVYWAGREDAGTEELFQKVQTSVEALRKKKSGDETLPAEGRSELRTNEEMISLWNKSTPSEKRNLLEARSVKEGIAPEALEDWLMYVLLDPDFVNRRRVVELNNWNPGLLMDPEVLLKHLSRPWVSLEKYGEPAMPPGQEFNEIQALRNKRMTLLILLVERVAENLTSRLVLDSEEARAYVIKIRDALASQVRPEVQDWIDNFEAKYESLKLAQARNPDFAIGEKRPMSFLDVFMLEAVRYDGKSARDQYRDSYGWFHDDYFFSFVYALGVPELKDLLNRLEERIEEEKRTGSRNTSLAERNLSKSENSRSELRSYGEASLDDAIFDLTRAEDADLRREALGELRKLTMQKQVGLDESSPAKKDKQAAQLLSLLADPDSGVRNGTARVIARIDNFSFEKILEFLFQPVIHARYSDRQEYVMSAGIRNARLAALFALAGTMKEDRLLRRDLRWPVFAASLNPDVFGEISKLPRSAGQARSLLESPGKQPLTALFAAGMFMQGPWKYAREAVSDLLPSLPESAAEAVFSSEGAARSELRSQAARDVRSMIESTALMPANLFISYEDIRSSEKPVYEDLFALAYLTRSDRNTRVVIYGVDAEDMMEERIKQLRDTAGVLMMQGSLQDAYQLYGRENPLQTKEGGTHSVHWSLSAERLKNQPGDLLLFLAESNQDLYAALLLARSGGELPGVSKGQNGFYSVTENFLREELQRFQASLVIERAA